MITSDGTQQTANVSYVGVYQRDSGNYQARIRKPDGYLTLGTYPTPEKASDAFCKAYFDKNLAPAEPMRESWVMMTEEQAGERYLYLWIKDLAIWSIENGMGDMFYLPFDKIVKHFYEDIIQTNKYIIDGNLEVTFEEAEQIIHNAIAQFQLEVFQDEASAEFELQNGQVFYFVGMDEFRLIFSTNTAYAPQATYTSSTSKTSKVAGLIIKVWKAVVAYFKPLLD